MRAWLEDAIYAFAVVMFFILCGAYILGRLTGE